MAKLTIYKYVRLDAGWRYCKAAFHPNGKIKPNIVILKGQEQKHAEGSYFLNFTNQWLPVGPDALEAQRKRAVRLAQMDYERLRRNTAAPPQVSDMIQCAGERKIIQAEVDAYLANLELAKRSSPTISDKRRFMASFLTIVPKKFVDEFERNDVLAFRNKRMAKYEPKSVDTQMMVVVTFFNRWLRVKLGMEERLAGISE